MKKLILLAVLVVVLALPMLACGMEDSQWAPPTPEVNEWGMQHSIDLAACDRLCRGSIDPNCAGKCSAGE